jgi:transposase
MKGYHYVGLDVHKKTIAYCVKQADGTVLNHGTINATRKDLYCFADSLPRPWAVAMEATLFTGWIYDFLRPHADDLKVGHSYMLRAICASKKKNDRLDAEKLADALRCNWFPEAYMPGENIRQLRIALRYRNLLVREHVRMKNKTAGLLMEMGAEYNKQKLHGRKYFNALLDDIDYIPDSIKALTRTSHESARYFDALQKRIIAELTANPLLNERVEKLMTISGVGQITALTWALEVDDPHRFANIKKAVSYCGLCSGQDESAGKARRSPLSKQRNKHLQTILIEAAKLAPQWNPALARVRQKAIDSGANKNEATILVARKLVAYMLAVDKSGKEFIEREITD